MPYTPTTWVNGSTPIDAANLNNMESGIVTANAALPVVVASAINTHITTTGLQTFLSWTPTATGVYRANFSLSYSNASATTLTAELTFKDPNLGNPGIYFSYGAQQYQALAIGGPGSITIPFEPLTFYAQSGTAIQLKFNDSAGTPNDFVTGIIEQLA
jgi:hypothetical protein